jgi:hypothetical protein
MHGAQMAPGGKLLARGDLNRLLQGIFQICDQYVR